MAASRDSRATTSARSRPPDSPVRSLRPTRDGGVPFPGEPVSPRNRALDHLAASLWNIERKELQSGEAGPAFHEYADGAQEPMPFHLQDEDFKTWWRNRARQIL